MTTDELEQLLHQVREKRGYLLPHHGLMATALPGMLEDYDQLYSSLALTPRHLDRHGHETVWLAVLIATNEALGTHHIARFHEAGGRDEELASITSLAAFCRGASAWHFVDSAWAVHLPDFDARSAYGPAFLRAAGSMSESLAHLSALAAYACAGEWELLRWQLADAYSAGVDEAAMAEALSLIAFPGSVPNFARACGVWREEIASGALAASEPFQIWAEFSGQGGYDEAANASEP